MSGLPVFFCIVEIEFVIIVYLSTEQKFLYFKEKSSRLQKV